MRICDPCSDFILFPFIFDPGRCVPEYSSDKQCRSKVKEKASGTAAYAELSFKKCERV